MKISYAAMVMMMSPLALYDGLKKPKEKVLTACDERKKILAEEKRERKRAKRINNTGK